MNAIEPHFDPILADLLDVFPSSKGLKLPAELEESRFLVGGWFAHVQNGVEAITLLVSNGLARETATVRRSVIEHTVALKWIRFERAAVLQTVVRTSTMGMVKANDATNDAYATSIPQHVIDQMQAIADNADASNDNMRSFANRIKKLTGKVEYADYMEETQLAHPSGQSALIYATDMPKYDKPGSQAAFCCLYLLYALEHLNNIFAPQPWPGLLDKYIGRIVKATKQSEAAGTLN